MTQYTFGIFAHPDDAAFGPGGTLALMAQAGTEVHLVCVTCGGAGVNVDGHAHLSDIREAEEKAAAEIMGVASCEMLRYDDGQLCNNTYLEIADKIIAHIRRTVTESDSDVTLITFDPNGISGHLDHIAVAMMTTYAYLKMRDKFSLRLKYFCIPESFSPSANTGWLYMPKGRRPDKIDEIIDVRPVKEQKIAAIKAHTTQKHDAETHLSKGDALFDEHFTYFRD